MGEFAEVVTKPQREKGRGWGAPPPLRWAEGQRESDLSLTQWCSGLLS